MTFRFTMLTLLIAVEVYTMSQTVRFQMSHFGWERLDKTTRLELGKEQHRRVEQAAARWQENRIEKLELWGDSFPAKAFKETRYFDGRIESK